MKRHIGKMANTDQRLVVAFMQIPGREDHALVIPTDTLPARFEQAVMEVLESSEGQGAETLADVLSRRLMPDSGKSVLVALHEGNMLKPVPVGNIMMMPMPNMPFPLVSILEQMGRSVEVSKTISEPQNLAIEKYNQIAVNQKIESIENRRASAQNLIIEAEMLEAEGRKKREQAYKISPEMAPRTVSTPVQTPVAQTPVTAPAALKMRKPRVAKAKG